MLLASQLIHGEKCGGCGGTGKIRSPGYPEALCGACHGRGALAVMPRWVAHEEAEREWREAIDAPLGT